MYGADPRYGFFMAVDQDRSGRINSTELQAALMNGDWTRFSMSTIELLINMFDRDQSGTLEFNEFVGVWNYIEQWKPIFFAADKDRSGSIDKGELMGALRQFGLNVQPSFVDTAIKKLAAKQGNAKACYRQPPASVNFDGFIFICVLVNNLTSAFRSLDKDQNGVIQIGYHQFLELSLATR
ncbi:EF-hand [Ramicandelaber brevisporus]|nr:EF-hand [Ramicandelaber brevisporus]